MVFRSKRLLSQHRSICALFAPFTCHGGFARTDIASFNDEAARECICAGPDRWQRVALLARYRGPWQENVILSFVSLYVYIYIHIHIHTYISGNPSKIGTHADLARRYCQVSMSIFYASRPFHLLMSTLLYSSWRFRIGTRRYKFTFFFPIEVHQQGSWSDLEMSNGSQSV